MSIKTCTTAVESPFSNGTVKCLNLIVAETMEKTLEDEKCEPEIALAWEFLVLTALQYHLEHSPNELVFGLNIITPLVLTDHLPALEAATTCKLNQVKKISESTEI